jgi:hypothetical protein
MTKWKFTSYQDGQEITRSGLSQPQAVSALEKAIAGEDPFAESEPGMDLSEQRQTVTDEQLIAA